VLRSKTRAPGRRLSSRNVPQTSLFTADVQVLTDDARGRIAYEPGFVDRATARAWFDEIRDRAPWTSQRRQMYDREVDVPRLTARYRADDADAPPAIREAAARVHAHTGVAFTSVGLNFYRDGRDSVAMHNDHLYELEPGFPIALLSLGAARRMTIRSKEAPKRSLALDLEPGSLLVMSYETQLHYLHGIPKTKEDVAPRISLAFRVRPARPAGRY
jgi:alkylated DNA repair dioxygenase AlkB